MKRTLPLLWLLVLSSGCGPSSEGAAGSSGAPSAEPQSESSPAASSESASSAPGAEEPGAKEPGAGGTLPTAGDPPPDPATATPEDLVLALRAHEAALSARPEHEGLADVRVQHVLISFAGRGTNAQRPQEEAEKLAAKVWAEAVHGADFSELVDLWSDDPGRPGIYAMTSGQPKPGVYPRKGMVPAFGNVGWRLDVGEIGVAGYDARNSPYGWHIIKRIE